MVKVFCDRCGKEVDVQNVALIKRRAYQRALVPDPWPEPDNSPYGSWRELCNSCAASFAWWFDHPEEEKHDSGRSTKGNRSKKICADGARGSDSARSGEGW